MRRFASSCSPLVFSSNQIGAQALSSDDASLENPAAEAGSFDPTISNKSRRYFLIGATSAVAAPTASVVYSDSAYETETLPAV